MTKLIKYLLVIATVSPCRCFAQKLLISYTTELQSDFKKGSNWVNLLRLDFSAPLSPSATLEAATLSTAKTRTESLAHDWQTFSNIEEDNHPLAVAVLGIRQPMGNSSLFIGIRNLNEDYFTSPATNLFTNSSCGIFPTLSADYPIANYPVSSMGVHYELQQAQWDLQASLYNGKGSYRFTGKENVFRFCPQHDGILCLTSFNYRHHDSNYHMGFALHSGMYRNYAEGDTEQASKKEKKEIRKIIWGYAEQTITPRLQVLLQVSAQWHASQGCKHYSGAGLVWQCGKTEGGLFTDYARFSHSHECASEFTWKIPCLGKGFIQPTLHLIHQPEAHYQIGLLRFGYVLPAL